MAISDGYREMVLEQLALLGPVRIRRMFSGGGVFLDGLMFGLIADDVLYFKADDSNRASFEAEGTSPFIYTRQGKPMALSYWQVPDRLFDEPDELLAFARAALAVARRAAVVRQATGARPAPERRKSKAGSPRRPARA